jgi:DUF1365 family protein
MLSTFCIIVKENQWRCEGEGKLCLYLILWESIGTYEENLSSLWCSGEHKELMEHLKIIQASYMSRSSYLIMPEVENVEWKLMRKEPNCKISEISG